MEHSCKGEKWENVIEYELDFYFNIQEYEDNLMERYYESQVIHYPVTVFDEDQGRVYLAGRDTEDQAIYRMEVKESIIALLRKAVKRITRLNNAISQLNEDEQDIIWMFYLERDMPELHMARTLGYRTQKEFMKEKEKVLKKLFRIYEKERMQVHQDFKATLKEELRRKAFLFKKAAPSIDKAII
jgi:hypothetical protein